MKARGGRFLLCSFLFPKHLSRTTTTTSQLPCTTSTSIMSTTVQEPSSLQQHQPFLWPDHNNPFHKGEVQLQRRYGVHGQVMSYAPKFVRPLMPDQHRLFYEQQPFLVVAARNNADNSMWASLLVASAARAATGQKPTAASSPDPATLLLHGDVVPGDALDGQLVANRHVGILGIELATKRRNRVNGRIVAITEDAGGDNTLTFAVDQSFGNCPQYIAPRQWWWYGDSNAHRPAPVKSRQLSQSQVRWIQNAETLFTATGYHGEGTDVRYGNDASHRGGPAGFVRVLDEHTLLLPDFAGNNHFNSLGNLLLDPRMGIAIPSFATGGLLQLSGTARVLFDDDAEQLYPQAERVVVFTVEKVNELPAGSLPIRWSASANADLQRVKVARTVQESIDVKSFYLEPVHDPKTGIRSALAPFRAGQYLPIHLDTEEHGAITRTYSLSQSHATASSGGDQHPGFYRISVKRHGMGKASNWLHDHLKEGDTLRVETPTGDFALDGAEASDKAPIVDQPIVLTSVGIGITPVLAMLDQLMQEAQTSTNRGVRHVVWLHGARNGAEHAFANEVEALRKKAATSTSVRLTTCTAYSKPREQDSGRYDVKGRFDASILPSLCSNWKNAKYYMCGPPGFVAEMEESLVVGGVSKDDIHFESF